MNLARTDVGVRPVVAWLETTPGEDGGLPLAEDVLIPRLDAHEVAAVFTAPFEAFLSLSAGEDGGDDTTAGPGPAAAPAASFADYLAGPPLMRVPSNDSDAGGASNLPDPGADDDRSTAWYAGQWIEWHGEAWYLLPFYAILRSIPNRSLGACTTSTCHRRANAWRGRSHPQRP